MKKVNLVFRVLLILAAVAAAVHTMTVYLGWILSPTRYFSSAPAEVTFLLLVPYAFGICMLLLIWLIVWLVKRKKMCYHADDENAR